MLFVKSLRFKEVICNDCFEMKVILRIILLSICIYSCSDSSEELNTFKYDTEVIAVFTPKGIGDYSQAGLIYKGIIKAADSLGIAYRPVFPLTYEEGAQTIADLVKENEPGIKRLIISTDPEYSEYLREYASEGLIIDSDSTKLLVLDGGFTHSDVYTAYIPLYGLMYKAGYVAGKMRDVENVRIYIANDKYRYIREARDGFIDGFALNKKGNIDVVNLASVYDDDTDGFQKSSFVYISDAPECSGVYDMVMPICGETILGFLRYNREFPGSFYTVGVETDMSVFSSDVPFSCVEHLDRVVDKCIADWYKGRLKRCRAFGMDEGWLELVISENYRNLLEPASKEIHAQAIKVEADYEM